jgi:hypothetical protein
MKRKQQQPPLALPLYAVEEARAAMGRREQQRAAGVRADGPPNTNQIKMFLHCGKCLDELKAQAAREGSASPRDYARLSVGWTPLGIQVWCNRHDLNVLHVDFEGFQHPGNTTAPKGGSDVRH